LAQLDDCLRDIEERRLPELRAQLEMLESDSRTDVTQVQTGWLKRLIGHYETDAANLSAYIVSMRRLPSVGGSGGFGGQSRSGK
jgi:hypothetical protein